MSDVQGINSDLDLGAAIASRDQMISVLQGRVAELESSLKSADDVAQNAMIRSADLEAEMAAKSAKMAQMTAHLAALGAPSVLSGPRVKLTAPHGYIDDTTGRNMYWMTGEVVSDPDVIATLKARGAPVQDL